MKSIFVRQFLILIFSIFTLTLFTYSLVIFFNLNVDLTQQKIANTNIFVNYFYYLENMIKGNWGVSITSGRPILKTFLIHLPATLELSIAALLFALAIGLPLGVIAAKNKYKWQDKLITSSTIIVYSMPVFWWGILLVLFFSIFLGIMPVGNRIGFEYDILPKTGFILIDSLLMSDVYGFNAFYSAIHHLVLPTVVLGTIPLAIFTKITRSAMIDTLSSGYIRTAKAKGLSSARIIWIHALRNAIIPIMTIIGLQINALITGTLIAEIIFSWPGIGKWLLESVTRRDYAAIHGGIFAISLMVIIINMLLEIISHYANPKSRLT